MTDLNGDGFLGNHKYIYNKKIVRNYVADVLFLLVISMIVTCIVLTLLAYSNNKLGIEALQTIIAGSK